MLQQLKSNLDWCFITKWKSPHKVLITFFIRNDKCTLSHNMNGFEHDDACMHVFSAFENCSCTKVEWLNCQRQIQNRIKKVIQQVWSVNLMTIEYDWYKCSEWLHFATSVTSTIIGCEAEFPADFNTIYLNCSDNKCALSDVVRFFLLDCGIAEPHSH